MAESTDAASRLGGLRLLLVEDEMMLAMSLADLLERQGCEIVNAPSVDKALARIEKEVIDGALLDINVRGARVYPVAAELARREIPFLFMTGYDPSAIDAPWRDRPLVRKPFTLDALTRAAAQTFGRA